MPTLQLKPHDQTAQEPVAIHWEPHDDGYRVKIGHQTVDATLEITQPGEGLLHLDNEVLPFYLTRKGDLLQVWVKGKTYVLEVLQPQARRGAGGTAAGVAGDVKAPMPGTVSGKSGNIIRGNVAGDVKAPMPGTVLKIQAKEGDAVEANQALVIMESMKMEMTLAAPAAGVIQKVLCSEGQLVDMGAILVQLESSL